MDFNRGAFGMFQKIPQAGGVASALSACQLSHWKCMPEKSGAAFPPLLDVPGGAAFGKGTGGLFLSVGTFHGGLCGCGGAMADGQEVWGCSVYAGGFHRFLAAVPVRALAHGCDCRDGYGNCGGICRIWDCVFWQWDAEKENRWRIGKEQEGDVCYEDV